MTACRSCGSDRLHLFLDLGVTPSANKLLDEADLDSTEPLYPLQVAFCEDCTLVQLLHVLPA